jgi:transcriptional regulator with XRE-family HTH domain
MSLGARIAARRSSLDMSQEYLAELIDSTQRQISKYENGVNQPTAEVLSRLADALQTTTDYLLGRTEIIDRPLRGQGDLTELERETIRVLREKTPDQQRRILDIIGLVH